MILSRSYFLLKNQVLLFQIQILLLPWHQLVSLHFLPLIMHFSPQYLILLLVFLSSKGDKNKIPNTIQIKDACELTVLYCRVRTDNPSKLCSPAVLHSPACMWAQVQVFFCSSTSHIIHDYTLLACKVPSVFRSRRCTNCITV